MNLLPFGQPVKIKHKYLEYEIGWITNVRPSYFVHHNWQYEIRTDKRLRSGYFLWGGEWFDESHIEVIEDGVLPMNLNIETPEQWPPKAKIGRRPGLWLTNGHAGDTTKMYSWNPGAVTCFYDYLQFNNVFEYKDKYPNLPVIVRFQHDLNWHENPSENAKNKANEIISKWNDVKILDPYVYFANEVNLHYENGDENIANQWKYETPEFYERYANWIGELADRIKQAVPEMNLVCPPFAFGHFEDGAPEDGIPKAGWCGYDYLVGYESGENIINKYFDNILTGHYYWGNAGGSNHNWLYSDESAWYAFRWRKVLELFKIRYDMDCQMIIDEAGNFATHDSDFTEQVIYYANETLKDNRIIALTYFLWHDPTGSPGNTPNDWQKIRDLDSHIEALKNMLDVYIESPNEPEPPIPEPPPPPPEPPKQNVKMNIERGEGLHLIVGNWLEKDIDLEFISPSGNVSIVRAGTKLEFGDNGFEVYASESGEYRLFVDMDYEFKIPMNGKFTKLSFEYTDDQPEVKVKIVSDLIDEDEAESIFNQLNELYPGMFEVSYQ